MSLALPDDAETKENRRPIQQQQQQQPPQRHRNESFMVISSPTPAPRVHKLVHWPLMGGLVTFRTTSRGLGF